jgi:hypothetical protein
MTTSPTGLGPENDCQQQLETTDPASRQRGRPNQQTHDCLTVIKIWS